MSADPRIRNSGAPASRLGETLYFDAADHKLFGWLHRPSVQARAGVGLVICKPFGYEAICAHRSLRAFADAAAGIGVPSLRFDYLGTGDSAEIEPQADQLAVWARDVVAAVAELQRLSGVDRVCLLGVRLGALLAALAAGQCKAVAGLILIAPVISGRRYLRELRTTVMAGALSDKPMAMGDSPVETQPAVPGALEIGGFSLSAATLSALALVDLNVRAALPVSEVLIIDGDAQPLSRAWAEQLSRTAGGRAKYMALPGFVEMAMTTSQYAAVPQEMVEAARNWLTELPRDAAEKRSLDVHRSEPPSSVMSLPANGDHPLMLERPVFFTSEALLFGIVTEPRQGENRRRAVILLNASADYHIGAGRMYVALARRWARRGYVVLRMDLAGIGDSGTREGRPDNEIFPPAAIEDIRAAIEMVRTRYGASDVTLAGVCSGAYHALRAAAAALPLNRILMVNPQNFFWKEGTTAEDMQMSEFVQNASIYRERLFSVAAWRKLTSGRVVRIGYIMRICFHRALLTVESLFRDVARLLRIQLPGDLGSDLEQIAKRGVQVVFVFARGEPGIDLLEILGGSSLKRLGNRYRVHIIDSADHTFSRSGARAVLEKILSDELYSSTEWSAPRCVELKPSS